MPRLYRLEITTSPRRARRRVVAPRVVDEAHGHRVDVDVETVAALAFEADAAGFACLIGRVRRAGAEPLLHQRPPRRRTACRRRTSTRAGRPGRAGRDRPASGRSARRWGCVRDADARPDSVDASARDPRTGGPRGQEVPIGEAKERQPPARSQELRAAARPSNPAETDRAGAGPSRRRASRLITARSRSEIAIRASSAAWSQ